MSAMRPAAQTPSNVRENKLEKTFSNSCKKGRLTASQAVSRAGADPLKNLCETKFTPVMSRNILNTYSKYIDHGDVRRKGLWEIADKVHESLSRDHKIE
jgi:hypothetical protein